MVWPLKKPLPLRFSRGILTNVYLVESGTGQKTTEEERNKDQHMCQALLDVVSAHIRKPNINHTLNRTFGPVLEKLRPGLFVENLLIE